ncbi:hypothetical protein B0I32_102289 [Nonomuraea fuscirosea]|uniref:Uncharacterized protein n=1 Tax=Nonomuraea fuscirosea TaxID=1291556 RepID=A0A2T0N8V9_9ACTN|nr:hypothetical protein B0I32_102289 [Nonomuraea fuscirosea]
MGAASQRHHHTTAGRNQRGVIGGTSAGRGQRTILMTSGRWSDRVDGSTDPLVVVIPRV